MNERIKLVRKDAGLTQDKFADQLKISKNYVCLLETGRKEPGDRLISDIGRAFGFSEEWLRSGTGEMHAPKNEDDEIAEIVAEML